MNLHDDDDQGSQVSDYYKDKSIFVTGATGFLGKVLIEKLLRSCGDLKCIYVLIRVKKGKTARQRLEEVLVSHGLFERVKEKMPDYQKKLVPIEGDLAEPELGISQTDQQLLAENVNIVFHSAATVRFDEPMKVAININVIGTKKVIELSKSFKNLEVFVHVSTAFANCDKKYVTEEIFRPPVMPDRIIEAVECLHTDVFEIITNKMIHPRPNTYTYTKAIAEYLVLKESKSLPCVIIRPSIVGACWLEPYPGWVDNYNAATGLFNAAQHGFLKCVKAQRQDTLDIVPVDIVINTMLVAAWHTGSNRLTNLYIYNSTSENVNRLMYDKLVRIINHVIERAPCKQLFLVPKIAITSSGLVQTVNSFTSQIVPSFVIDLFLKLINKRPFYMRLQSRLKMALRLLRHFIEIQLEFSRQNYLIPLSQMSNVDKKKFHIDTHSLDWNEYIENYLLGVRKYVEKEDLTKIDLNRKHYIRMKLVVNFAYYGTLLLIIKLVHSRSSLIRKSLAVFLDFVVFLIKQLTASLHRSQIKVFK